VSRSARTCIVQSTLQADLDVWYREYNEASLSHWRRRLGDKLVMLLLRTCGSPHESALMCIHAFEFLRDRVGQSLRANGHSAGAG
jgi:hypothetical protein